MSVKIILGDTSPITKKVFTLSLEAQNYPLIFVEDEASLKEAVEKEKPQVVVVSSNITSNLEELIREISSKYPSIKILVLKSPFERTELTETENIKIIMKPVPSSKIKEYIAAVEKSLAEETPGTEAGEEFPEEETRLPEEEELSEEELQATTWESHTSEEAFSDEDIFPEEEEEEEIFEEEVQSKEVIFEEKEPGEEEVAFPQEEFIEEVASPAEKAEEEVVMEETEQKAAPEIIEEAPRMEEIAPQPPEAREISPEESGVKERETPSEEVTVKEIPPEIIEKIAWEVIPPLAEKILREEIQKLIKKLEES